MKRQVVIAALAATMAMGMMVHAEETIKLTVPYIGIDQEAIDKAYETAEQEGTEIDYDIQALIQFVTNVAEKYPNYEVEWVDWGWAEELDQKQRALFTAGTCPDIVVGETFMPTYAREGLLEPLPDDIVEAVSPSFLVYDPDGVPVAVTWDANVFILSYNIDILEKFGYTEEDVQNMTWSRWKEISDDITARGEGEYWGGGIPSFPHAGGALRATPFLRMKGTDFGVDGKPNLEDPAVQEVLQYIREMDKNHPEGLANGSSESPLWAAFREDQNIAFAVNGPWLPAGLERNGGRAGYTYLPRPDEGASEDFAPNCLVSCEYMAVPKDAPNKEASFNIIREKINYDILRDMQADPSCNAIMCLKAVLEDEEVMASANPTVPFQIPYVLGDAAATGVANFEKNDTAIWEIINNQVLARTTITDDPIDEICSEAMEQIEALMQ